MAFIVVMPRNKTEFHTNCFIVTLLEFQSDFTTAFFIEYGCAFAQSKKYFDILAEHQTGR
jgi:hypothetical protein